MATATTDKQSLQFAGFSTPNGTIVPDEVFDVLLPVLREAELRALFYIIRRTFGFKKERDPISFNQFLRGIVTRDGRVLDRGCGIKNRTNLSRALKTLEELGVIESHKGWDERGENQTTVYRLRFQPSETEGVVPKEYYPSTEKVLPVVPKEYPQQTVEQQTVLQSNSSKDNGEKKFEEINDIKVETTVSKAVPEDRLSARSAITTNNAHPRRGGSGVTPIGHVLKQRVENWVTGGSPARGRHRQSSPSTPTEKGPLGPSGDRAGVHSTGDEQEGVPPETSPLSDASGSTGRRSSRLTKPSLQIEAIVTQFSSEFHDADHLDANINQAARLWNMSGRSEQAFSQLLFDAASATRRRGGLRNKMAYYFRVLRDLLGLMPQAVHSGESDG